MLSDGDFRLSMAISRQARDPDLNDGLRSMLVHRLTAGPKVVWRRSLQNENRTTAYCEPCRQWVRDVPLAEEFTHEACGRVYRVEFAVLEEVEDVEDDGEAGEV